MSEFLKVGDLTFEVIRSTRRRSVEITVDRDSSLKLRAPMEVDDTELARIVARRRIWVFRTLAAKRLLTHPYRPKEYVPGEGFYYLGRTYRLKLTDNADRLTLRNGWFLLPRSAVLKGRASFVSWYTVHATERLNLMVERLSPHVGARPKRVVVRDVGNRWASCGRNGVLYFHWRVVLLPLRSIEYLVLHELVHLREPLHTPAFWREVSRVMPDWELRRDWIARNGARFDL